MKFVAVGKLKIHINNGEGEILSFGSFSNPNPSFLDNDFKAKIKNKNLIYEISFGKLFEKLPTTNCKIIPNVKFIYFIFN